MYASYMLSYVCIVKHYIWLDLYMHRRHIIYGSYMYVCIVNTLYMACLICMHRKHIIYGLSYMYAS